MFCRKKRKDTRVTDEPESSQQEFTGKKEANLRTAAETWGRCAFPNPGEGQEAPGDSLGTTFDHWE